MEATSWKEVWKESRKGARKGTRKGAWNGTWKDRWTVARTASGELRGQARREIEPDRALTLIELIVVIAILGLLATIAIVNVRGILPDARRKTAVFGMRTILDAAEIHETKYGRYPESVRDMVDGLDELGRRIALLKGVPMDPWGREFAYEVAEEGPRVTCFGRDGNPGGTEEDADIILPAPESEPR